MSSGQSQRRSGAVVRRVSFRELPHLPPVTTLKFTNCRVYTPRGLLPDDLWVRHGRVIDPATRFWEAASLSEYACDVIVDCGGCILAPGFIDVQINGAYGVDFSDTSATPADIQRVCAQMLATGVTAIAPTIVSSAPETYAACVATFRRLREALAAQHREAAAHGGGSGGPPSPDSAGSGNSGGTPGAAPAASPPSPTFFPAGARLLGLHLEGPFINVDKKGAHAQVHLREPVDGLASLRDTYGHDIDWAGGEASIVTLAPELRGALVAAHALSGLGVVSSIGHTSADIRTADAAVAAGCTLITHLFNAMSSFHHRDPGVVGLLGHLHGGVKPKAVRRRRSLRPDGSTAPGSGGGDGASTPAAGARDGGGSIHDEHAAYARDRTPAVVAARGRSDGGAAALGFGADDDVGIPPLSLTAPQCVTLHEEGFIVPSSTAVALASASSTGGGLPDDVAAPLDSSSGTAGGGGSAVDAAADGLPAADSSTPATPLATGIGGMVSLLSLRQPLSATAGGSDGTPGSSAVDGAGRLGSAAAPPLGARAASARFYEGGSGTPSLANAAAVAALEASSPAHAAEYERKLQRSSLGGTGGNGGSGVNGSGSGGERTGLDSVHRRGSFVRRLGSGGIFHEIGGGGIVDTPAPGAVHPMHHGTTINLASTTTAASPLSTTPHGAAGGAFSSSLRHKREAVTPFSAVPFHAPAAATLAATPGLLSAPGAAGAPAKGTAAAAGVPPLSDTHGRPFYSIIVDGVHVHPYAVCTALRTHPAGIILVTDAMKAMGLPVGRHTLGECARRTGGHAAGGGHGGLLSCQQQHHPRHYSRLPLQFTGYHPPPFPSSSCSPAGELSVDIFHGLEDGHYEGLHAVLTGTATLAGAVVPLDK
jgi:N-acetylglucosamine-6-phosphate deacetylase